MGRQSVSFDPLRSLAFGSVTNSYTAIGPALVNPVRIVSFDNPTDGDMLISTDGSTDMLFIGAGTFKLFDLTTNKLSIDTEWVFNVGTQFYVKYSTAPSKSSVYIACLWGV